MATNPPTLKNRGPLLVDRIRGWLDQLPTWFRGQVALRVEHQKVDSQIDTLNPDALQSQLTQEVTDEKLRRDTFLGDGAAGSGNDFSDLPASNPGQIVIETGQVADKTETVSADQIPLVAGPPLQQGTSEQIGDIWVTKTVTAPTFDDARYQVQIPDLLPESFRSHVPTKTEKHTVNGTAAMPTLGSGELSRAEEQQKVGVKGVTVQSRNLTSTPLITGMRYDQQWNGARLIHAQQIVPAGTKLTQSFGMTDATVKPIDDVNSVQEWSYVDGSFPTPFWRSYNTDLQTTVTTLQYIVPLADTYAPDPYDLEWEEKYIDAYHKLRRIDRIAAFPATFDVYVTRSFTFPGLLTYLSFGLVSLAAANRKDVQYAVGVRAPFTVPTVMIDRTEFFLNPPSYSSVSLLTWAPTDIVFKGLSYTINIPNVLCDTMNNMGVTFAGDAYYGNTVDRFNVAATNPSATSYISWIGTWAIISMTVDHYKRIWVRKTTYVNLR